MLPGSLFEKFDGTPSLGPSDTELRSGPGKLGTYGERGMLAESSPAGGGTQ
jgi:hypothetical protein